MFEIEQKFLVANRDDLLQRLKSLGAVSLGVHTNSDTYYRHPCRNFVETQEALRIRRTDGIASITYKGKKLPQADATMKVRKELEWELGENDIDGKQTDQLLLALGFEHVTTVTKYRESFSFEDDQLSDFTVTLDDVDQVGQYAEIELLLNNEAEIEGASWRIEKLASDLLLDQSERRSYLELLLGE